MASGNNNGSTCADAYSISINNPVSFQFSSGQQTLYFDLTTPTNDDLFLSLTENNNPLPMFKEIRLYQHLGCGNLILKDSAFSEDSVPIDQTVYTSMVANTLYLLEITRDISSGSPAAQFDIGALHYLTFPCPSDYNLTCDELIENGDFDAFTVDPNGGFFSNTLTFNRMQVCEWEPGDETPSIISGSNDLSVTMWAKHFVDNGQFFKRQEEIVTAVDITPGENYVISFKLRRFNDNGNLLQLPEVFNVRLMDDINLPNLQSKPTGLFRAASLETVNPSQLVASIPDTEMDGTGSWKTHSVCFTVDPNQTYDRIAFFPKDRMLRTAQSWIEVDDISLVEFKADAGPDLELADGCLNGGQQIGPECPIPGATYAWSPSTGLSDPNIPNPIAIPTSNTTYTVTVTHPGSSCSATDQVTISKNTSITIPHASDVQWLRNNVSAGLNSIADKDFFVDGDLIIDEDYTFLDCNFIMGEDAEIIVRDGSLLTIRNNNTTVESMGPCDPNVFWKGITVSSNDDGIIIETSDLIRSDPAPSLEIYNMSKGIRLIENPDFRIEQVDFDRNHRSIKLEGQGALNSSHTLRIINDCHFTCSSPLIAGNGTEYYPGLAIEMYHAFSTNQYVVVVRSETARGLIFDAKAGGIGIVDTDIDIEHAEFNNFDNSLLLPGAIPVTDEAILVHDDFLIEHPYVDVHYSTFNACHTGIRSFDHARLSVSSNTVNGTGYPGSAFARITGNTKHTSIGYNTINNVEAGIVATSCGLLFFENNVIDLEVQPGTGYTLKQNNLSLGIGVYNFNYVIPESLIRIKNNTIKHANTGIHVEFAKAEIHLNEIEDLNDNLPPPPANCAPFCPPPSQAHGIRVLNADDHVVIVENKVKLDLNNYSSSPEDNVRVIGIAMENSTSILPPAIECNTISGSGIGLKFVGSNHASTDVEKNSMQDHFYGFVLANNGFIGDVGSVTAAGDNEWNWTPNFPESHTFADNSNGNNCIIYYRNTGNFNPSIDQLRDFINGTAINKSATTSPNGSGCSAPQLRVKSGGNASSIDFAKALTRGRRNYMVQAADSNVRLNRQLIYRQLLNDSAMAADTAFKAFADSVKNTQLGKAFGKNTRAVSATGLDHFDKDIQIVSAISNRIETGQSLSSSDSSDLRKIAYACPFYKGIAVYQARHILYSMGHSLIYNDCELVEKQSKTPVKRLKELDDDKEVLIYPNPSNGAINIRFEITKNQIVIFELIDILGKKQEEMRLTEGNLHQIQLTNKQRGIYFYRLVNEDSVLKTGKLIIN